ncbi:hypothetical protein [Psychrobacillus sp. FSL K6-1464]|uniref:hypothetical protein n=1 Tax=Psychrobacillus sp. FSL K6-1464 TaxID=2921545 RepID=UPI0030F72B55
MKIVRHNKRVGGEVIKSMFIYLNKHMVIFSLAETNWFTKGKPRLIPIWIKKRSLFAYRLAIRISNKKRGPLTQIKLLDDVLKIDDLDMSKTYEVIRTKIERDDLYYIVINEKGGEVAVHELLASEIITE